MSYDIQLDTRTHDLVFADNGDLLLVDGAARVAQQIKVTLLTFLGEWFLDSDFGVPYLEEITIKNPRMSTVQTILRARINDVPGVTRVRSLTLRINRQFRELSVEFEAETLFGLVGPHNVALKLMRNT
jgi:hypothetical protein